MSQTARAARVALNRTVTVATATEAGPDLRTTRMVSVGLGGCSLRGDVIPTGTPVCVFVDSDLVIVGRALPVTEGDLTTRLEWSLDNDDILGLVERFGIETE